MNQAPNQLISNFCPGAENGDRGFLSMVKCWKLVGQPDTRTCPARLSRWISKGPESRSPLPSIFLALLPSIWRELTTRRLHGQSLEPQGWLEVCLKLRHWPDSVINSIYRCARVWAVWRASAIDRHRARARVCLIHEWNDVGRDSIGGKVIESQKSRGKKFCNCDDDCGEVLRCDWGGGGGRTLLTWNNGV